jgi:hypothetical protein
LLTGPRQVGKSSLFKHHMEASRLFIDLDDLAVRQRATEDPVLFARELRLPLFIDEIQYAPQLLSPIKVLADAEAPPGSIWLTGSQSFEVMTGVRQTLAGRVAILNLYGLTDAEKRLGDQDPGAAFRRILQSTFPRLAAVEDEASLSLYFKSYLETYVERDVRELLGIQKRRGFELFLRACALRTAQVVNYDELGRASGVSAVTAKEWLSLLQDSFLVRLCRPYFSNRSKRLIKAPKLYFLDAGLAAYLAGWRDPEMARLGPMGGALFETHIFGELTRTLANALVDGDIHFWRTRDGAEIDFLVEYRGRVQPVEVKMGTVSPRDLAPLDPIAEPNWKPGVAVSLAHQGRARVALRAGWSLIAPATLRDILLS